MLKRLYVDNYRCLVNFEFKPERVNLLVGANGSGKSTFLEVLKAIRNVLGGMPLATALPPNSRAWWDSPVQTFELEIGDPQDGEVFQYRLRVSHPATAGVPLVEEESLRSGGKPLLTYANKQVTLVAEAGTAQSFAFEGVYSPLSAGLGDNSRLARFRALTAGIALYRLNPWAVETRSNLESAGLMSEGTNFVSYLRGVAQGDPRAYARWQAAVAVALPHVRSLRLQDLGAGSRFLTGTVLRPGNGEQTIPFFDFSEGEKCLAILHAVAVTRDRATILALDEPDNFLSLREVQPVLKAIVEPTEGAAPQVFIVSHHPEAIDYLAADATWLFERPAGEHVRVRAFTFDREKGERASESVRAELQ